MTDDADLVPEPGAPEPGLPGTGTGPPHPAATARRRHPLVIAASVLLLLVIVGVVLVPQYASGVRALESFGSISPSLVLAALTLELASLLCYSALSAEMIGPPTPRFRTLLRIDLTDLGIRNAVPGGGATAAAARYRFLRQAGVRPENALTAATIQLTGSNLALGALFALGVALSLRTFSDNLYYRVAGIAVLALLAAAALAVWLLTRHPARSVTAARAVARRLPLVTEAGAESFVRTLGGQIRLLATHPRRLLVVVVLSAANWLLDAAALWVLLAAFGYPLAFGPLLTVYGLGTIVAMLPLTPGGLGIVEAVMVPALIAFGAPREAALLGVLGWRLLEYWLPLPLGLAAWLSLRWGSSRRRDSPGHPPE